jgi:MFS family permease
MASRWPAGAGRFGKAVPHRPDGPVPAWQMGVASGRSPNREAGFEAMYRRRRLIVTAVLLTSFMAAMEGTVISTVMPDIVSRLGGFAWFSWAFGIYLLTQAVTTPLYGRLADSHGRKPIFLLSLSLFLVGSMLCGCSWSMGSLILFRGLQGLGAGGLVPLGVTIIGDVSKPSERPRMLGYISAVWGFAAIIGPILGALLLAGPGWRSVFWVNVPVGLVAMGLVVRYLDEPVFSARRAGTDWWSSGLLMLGIGFGMVALVQARSQTMLGLVACLASAAIALALFFRRERRAAAPLLALYLLRSPIIGASMASAVLCGSLLIAATGFIPVWVQGVVHGSALDAGWILGGLTVSWTVANLSAGRVLAGLTYRSLAVLGSVGLLVGFAGLLTLSEQHGFPWLMVSGMLIGAGLGVNSLVFTVAVQSAVAADERGRATGLF